MSELEPQLARITGVQLGIEDHGLLSSFIMLDYARAGDKIGGTGQGFGGYNLGGGTFASFWLKGVLAAVGVTEWDQLKGKMVWAYAEHSKVHKIVGLDTGITFDPSLFEEEER